MSLALTWPSGSLGQAPEARLVVLGTGTPYADPDRSGPALAVVLGHEAYLVDAGPGVVRRAAAASKKDLPALNPTNLKRVFLTHLHSDHTLGLPDLMFSPWTLGRDVPLEVYGPPGTRQMTNHIERAWAEDVRVRLGLEAGRHHNYRAVTQEIKAGRVYDDGKVRVDAIPVAHASWPSAFGYRFVTPTRTIVISGDARPSESLVQACNKCDILVHEVYSGVFFREQPNKAYHASAHTSTTELAEIAKRAQPALLLLYHQLYGRATDDDLKREIREAGYHGRVESARDLDIF